MKRNRKLYDDALDAAANKIASMWTTQGKATRYIINESIKAILELKKKEMVLKND